MIAEYTQKRTLQKTDNSKMLIAACAIIGTLILMGTNSPLFTLMGFAMCIIVCVQATLEFSLSTLFFILPMATIFKFAPGQTSVFTFVQLIWVLCAFYKTGMQATKTDIAVVLFSFYLLICQIFCGGLNISATIKLAFGILMLLMVKKEGLYDNYFLIFTSYIFGVLTSSLFMLINSPLFNIVIYVTSKTERLAGSESGDYITRFAGLYGDPNYYSVNLIIAMILLLCLFRKKKITAMQTVVLLIPLVFLAAKTGSKSALIMLIIPASLFIYISIKNKRYVIALASVAVIGIAIWMLFNGRIAAFSIAIQRLTANHSSLNELTTGRGAKWIEFLEYIWNRPMVLLFGKSLLNVTLNGGAPHNTYIDMFFQLGLVGTVWMTCILSITWIDRSYRRTVLNYSLVGAVFILYFFLSELQYSDFPFHLSLCLIVANMDFEVNENIGVEV